MNLEYIDDSLLLTKASGLRHFGGRRDGFDTLPEVGAAGRADYGMLLDRIVDGAACGGTPEQCVR